MMDEEFPALDINVQKLGQRVTGLSFFTVSCYPLKKHVTYSLKKNVWNVCDYHISKSPHL